MTERKKDISGKVYIAGSREWNNYLLGLKEAGKPWPINLRAGTTGQWVQPSKKK